MPFEEVALAEVSRASADAPDALRSYRKGNMGKNAFLGTRRKRIFRALGCKGVVSRGRNIRRVSRTRRAASDVYIFGAYEPCFGSKAAARSHKPAEDGAPNNELTVTRARSTSLFLFCERVTATTRRGFTSSSSDGGVGSSAIVLGACDDILSAVQHQNPAAEAPFND